MSIHAHRLDEWRRLAAEAITPDIDTLSDAGSAPCPRCAALGLAVLRLTNELEQLRRPYAAAFRDGATGALDFAVRAFDAVGDPASASILRQMRTVVGK